MGYTKQEINEKFLSAANGNDLDRTKKMLAIGADVNARNFAGWVAIGLFAFNGNIEAVRFLIDHGADINARSNSEASALCWAFDKNRSDIAVLLLEQGAEISPLEMEYAGKRKGMRELLNSFLEQKALNECVQMANPSDGMAF